MREALLYKKLDDRKVRCQVCSRQCLILPNQRGICGVRENQNGKLYALNYGRAIAVGVDPIEKKPLFHFLPVSLSFSFATTGCNLQCANCQNWQISQAPRIDYRQSQIANRVSPIINRKSDDKWLEINSLKLSPQEIVRQALENNCQSVAYTYTEPTIFLEYALETMKLAKKRGLKNVWVSNGYMSNETIKLIIPYLDAINVDLKFFNDESYQKYCQARLGPILENLKTLKEKNVWLEVTTLVIPTINDSEKELKQIAEFIKKELGTETPWHISKFSPEISWKLQHLSPTPDETIIKAREIGLSIGLKYVYVGNLWNNSGENTYCPKCGELNIERIGYSITRLDKNGKCAKCGQGLNLILK